MSDTTIQLRRGTAASAASDNPTLAAGEIGVELDTGKFKIGNGTTAWNTLPYATDLSRLPSVVGTVSSGADPGGTQTVVRAATLAIAASNATAAEKAQADYLCDGTADDLEINAALSSLTNGGTVHLSSGQFNLSNPIVFSAIGQIVHGSGIASGGNGGTYINAASITAAFTWAATANLWFCSVQSLQIQSGEYGLYFPASDSFTFWDFYARDVFVDGTSSHGFYAYDGHGFVLDHFIAEQCGGWGVYFPTTAVAEPEVRNGTFKSNTGGGIYMGAPGGVVAECEFQHMTGNAISLAGAGSKATDNWIGVQTVGSAAVGIALQASGTIAKGNVVNQCGSYGIEVQQGGTIVSENYVYGNVGANIYATYPCSIIGNFVLYGSSYGIEVNAVNTTVQGNYVHGAGSDGIYIASANYVSATGNVIENSTGNGIHSTGNYTTLHANVLVNSSSVTANSYDEINVSGTNVVVQGNVINGNSQSRYGVNFSSGTASGVCAFNQVSGEATDNYASLSYSVFWDPPTVSPKTSSYSLEAIDTTVIFTLAAPATATLPSAAAAGSGRMYTITNANGSDEALTIASSSGTTPATTIPPGASLRLISDGANWQAA